MYNRERLNPTLLHDLAFLYLELAHGADQRLDDREQRTIAAKLREWHPDQNPKMIDHVIREATLSYMDRPGPGMLDHIITELKEALPESIRMNILWDLAEIARADGKVLGSEEGFLDRLARTWGIPVRRNLVS